MSRALHPVLAPFDPRGRLPAAVFRHRLIRLLLMFFALLCGGIWLASFGFRALGLLTVASTLLVVLCLLAQTNRRLHDRGRSGWWLGLYVMLEAASTLPLEQAVDAHPGPVILVIAAMLGYFAWFCIETLLRPGMPGPNRYGPAPTDGRG